MHMFCCDKKIDSTESCPDKRYHEQVSHNLDQTLYKQENVVWYYNALVQEFCVEDYRLSVSYRYEFFL